MIILNMKVLFHWCQKTRYLCDWSVAEADWLNHHHVELHLRLCGQDYLLGQTEGYRDDVEAP